MNEYDEFVKKKNIFPNFRIMNEEEKKKYLQEYGLEFIDFFINLWSGYCSKCNEIEYIKRQKNIYTLKKMK